MTVLSYMARQRAILRARHEGETFVTFSGSAPVHIECAENTDMSAAEHRESGERSGRDMADNLFSRMQTSRSFSRREETVAMCRESITSSQLNCGVNTAKDCQNRNAVEVSRRAEKSFDCRNMDEFSSDIVKSCDRRAEEILAELENLRGLNKRERETYHSLAQADRA